MEVIQSRQGKSSICPCSQVIINRTEPQMPLVACPRTSSTPALRSSELGPAMSFLSSLHSLHCSQLGKRTPNKTSFDSYPVSAFSAFTGGGKKCIRASALIVPQKRLWISGVFIRFSQASCPPEMTDTGAVPTEKFTIAPGP